MPGVGSDRMVGPPIDGVFFRGKNGKNRRSPLSVCLGVRLACTFIETVGRLGVQTALANRQPKMGLGRPRGRPTNRRQGTRAPPPNQTAFGVSTSDGFHMLVLASVACVEAMKTDRQALRSVVDASGVCWMHRLETHNPDGCGVCFCAHGSRTCRGAEVASLRGRPTRFIP